MNIQEAYFDNIDVTEMNRRWVYELLYNVQVLILQLTDS